MTKKRNLTTFMIAIMIMLFSLPVNAEGTVGYAEFKGSTLTFYGGESVPDDDYALNTGSNNPSWYDSRGSVAKVVFDESFKDVRPTSCYQWFYSFSNLTTIEGIENLNTEEVTDMSEMFYNCSSLTSLDVSKFNTDKVKNMSYMFNGCSGLTTIYVSDGYTTAKVSNGLSMFYNCTSLQGAASYDYNKTDKSMANYTTGYFTKGTTAIDLLKSVATDDAEYYDINGRRIDAPAKGVNIVRRGNKTIKLIIK